MVNIESLQPQPPSKLEFLEYLKFEYLRFDEYFVNASYWPTFLAEYGYAPTLAGLETFLAEQDVTIYDGNTTDLYGHIYRDNIICGYIQHSFKSTLAELKLLAEYAYEPTLADLDTSLDFLQWFEKFQSEELRANIFEEYFNCDWRSGQEIHKVVITKRLYQTSPYSTQD